MRHICEVCGLEEILTPEDAFEAGWDYPPRIGTFGILGPRTCAQCQVNQTAWWAMVVDGHTTDMLSPKQRVALARIIDEPGSVAVTE